MLSPCLRLELEGRQEGKVKSMLESHKDMVNSCPFSLLKRESRKSQDSCLLSHMHLDQMLLHTKEASQCITSNNMYLLGNICNLLSSLQLWRKNFLYSPP